MPVPTPEDLIDSQCEPLRLDLVCRACKRKAKEQFDWAMVDPNQLQAVDGYDGITLARIVTCKRCGAVDDYELSQMARLHLLTNLLMDGPFRGRIIPGRIKLWDGTEGLRPSQAIAHLRSLCVAQPQAAEPLRRLGNVCNRYGLIDEAVEAWQKAVALEPDEFEAALSLTEHALDTEDVEVVNWLQRAVTAWPANVRRDPDLGRFAPGLADLLLSVAGHCADELCLMATWRGGRVRDMEIVDASVASLGLVKDSKHLEHFLQHGQVLSLRLCPGPVEDQPTRLQRLLAGQTMHEPAPRPQPVRVATPPGRNASCPCGSGRKYKRCCGGRSSG